MIIILLTPVFLSALLLGAHFLRSGSMLIAGFALLFPFVLVIRRAWAARLAQVFLVFGVIEWAVTLINLVAERRVSGQPWTWVAIILGSVMVFTGGSALIFSFSRLLRKRYEMGTAFTEENKT